MHSGSGEKIQEQPPRQSKAGNAKSCKLHADKSSDVTATIAVTIHVLFTKNLHMCANMTVKEQRAIRPCRRLKIKRCIQNDFHARRERTYFRCRTSHAITFPVCCIARRNILEQKLELQQSTNFCARYNVRLIVSQKHIFELARFRHVIRNSIFFFFPRLMFHLAQKRTATTALLLTSPTSATTKIQG